MIRRDKGVITIFLSLILVIILGLVCTIIESVRINLAKIQVERALYSAMNSTLSEYSLPILEQYGLIMLDASYGNDDIDTEKMAKRVEYYMEKNLTPNKNLTEQSLFNQIMNLQSPDYIDLYKFNVEDIEIANTIPITAAEAEIFKHEILEYMKYRGLVLGAEVFLEKLTKMEAAGKTTEILEKKVDIEEKAGKLDAEQLALIKIIDGFTINKKEKIKTEAYFIKKLFTKSEINSTNAKINNNKIFEALSNKFFNPSNNFSTAKSEILKAANYASNYWSYYEELEELNTEYNQLSGDTESNALKKIELLVRIRACTQAMNSNLTSMYSAISSCNSNLKEIVNLCEKNISNSNTAITKIDKIKTESDKLKAEISKFETELESKKDEIISETYESTKKDITNIKNSIYNEDSDKKYGNLSKIKETINKNIKVLEDAINIDTITSGLSTEILELGKSIHNNNTTSEQAVDKWIKAIDDAEKRLSSYSFEYLEFDYSNINLSKQEDPRDGIDDILKKFTIGLFLENADKISSETISKDDLPSVTRFTDKEEDNTGDFQEAKYIKKSLNIFTSIGSQISKKAKNITDEILINEYILDKCDTILEANSKDDSNTKKINYEVEYIITGKTSDLKNIESIINKLTLIRFALNFIHIMSDSVKRNEALAVATAIAGFAAFTGLVQLVQMLILGCWSYAEAIVDVRALLKGESVPFIKNSTDWVLDLGSLLSFSLSVPSHTKQDDKSNALSLSYKDYLRIFLLLNVDDKEKLYRTMDCIQLNLQNNTNSNFKMKNSIYSISVTAKVTIPELFLSFGFVPKDIKYEDSQYEFILQKSYSY